MANRKKSKKSDSSGAIALISVFLFVGAIITEWKIVLIILCSIGFIWFLCVVFRENKPAYKYSEISDELGKIDKMTGQQFEVYCMRLLRTSGTFENAKMSLTKTTGDFGVDILADFGDGVRAVVQCKRYAKNLGVKPVQEIYSGMNYYGAQISAVMTNSYFTESAIKLAKSTEVYLIDRDGIANLIQKSIERANAQA